MVAAWTVMCLCLVEDNKMSLAQVLLKQTRGQTRKALTTVVMQACRRLSQSSWYDLAKACQPLVKGLRKGSWHAANLYLDNCRVQ